MPSIRRSLIAYFLVLMGFTFLGVGVLVYQLVSSAMFDREKAEADRLRQEYEVRCRDTMAKFDDELLIHAQNIARDLRKEYSLAVNRNGDAWPRTRILLLVAPYGHSLNDWSTLVNIAATNNQGIRWTTYWLTLPSSLAEELIRRSLDDGDHPGWWQIHLPRTPIGRPTPIRPALQTVQFPLDADALDRDLKLPDDYHKHDFIQVPDEGEFRRVIVRYPLLVRLNSSSPTVRPREASRPAVEAVSGTAAAPSVTPTSIELTPTRTPNLSPTGTPPPLPGLYVQYARRKSDLDDQLAIHEAKLHKDLNDLTTATEYESRRVLFMLLALGALAVLPLPTGGWWLVHRGLKPLDNLTHAVSRVSEKDFRLPVERNQLSEELMPIHKRLSDTLDALRRAFEREKQAVADISHELRTPLAALRTTIEVTLRKPREAEQYRNALAECRDITKQLSRLVDRILMLAALDSGQAAPSRLPLDISEMAQECLTVIRPLAEEQQLQLRSEIQPGVRATTDPDKLREVVMNLLHNAVEYNRPGGEVCLIIARQGHEITLAVHDTGIGMTPSVQAKIFERFYRADDSRHAVGVHAGLGLAIVKEYVDRLHGTIQVQSEPGQGSTFTVVIPTVI